MYLCKKFKLLINRIAKDMEKHSHILLVGKTKVASCCRHFGGHSTSTESHACWQVGKFEISIEKLETMSVPLHWGKY